MKTLCGLCVILLVSLSLGCSPSTKFKPVVDIEVHQLYTKCDTEIAMVDVEFDFTEYGFSPYNALVWQEKVKVRDNQLKHLRNIVRCYEKMQKGSKP